MLIAGVVVLALAAGAGERLLDGERCVAPPELYGDPPAGYRYVAQRSLADDAREVRRTGSRVTGYLAAVRVPDGEEEDLDAVGERAAPGDVVSRGEIDGRAVARLAPENGGRIVMGFKACHLVQAGSADPRMAEEVARTVFGG
ncbi:hypothetical protein [Solirubrobacter deserti]|uniref:Uncharacterized protein n=1 Tax=Solirubrobacter deserti TaxID=2282478 RepID=A0ABT4RBR2_9ACTN|nr:hypothetical protein [Solirubrobacter deserti]MDA0135979.1 hypothetical protein [Solirubrobacter deserti]